MSADETLSGACLYFQSYIFSPVQKPDMTQRNFGKLDQDYFFLILLQKTLANIKTNGQKWTLLDWRSGLCLGLVGASHHWTVYGADAVVAHVQCCQVSPHRNESRDRTARLRPLSLPLWELARLRDQDGLEADTKMTGPVARHAPTQILQPSTQSEVTIIVSVDRWILRVARLDLRDDTPSICWELHSLIWGQRDRQKV